MIPAGPRPPGLAVPGDPAYRAATSVFNLAAPVRPAAAVTARSVAEIQAVVRYAKGAGLGVRAQATGHGAATARPMADAVLVRTALTGGVLVDPARRIAVVPAGTTWAEVVTAAAEHGLAAPHGSSPTVGVVGYLLRGGLSFYGRAVGLAANSVRAIELVDGAGDRRRVDADHDPELFAALRGGGGGLGIVTSVEVALFPVAHVVTGSAFWPARHAERLLSGWLAWTVAAPRAVTTTFQVMNLPDVPEVPAPLRAGPVVCVDGAVLGAADTDLPRTLGHADALLGPLRAVAPPLVDTWELAGPVAVPHTHLDPVDPLPMAGDHLLLTELDDAAAATLLRVVGPGSGSPLISAELRQLGGAFAEPAPGGGLLSHLDARFAYLGAGVPAGQADAARIAGHCALVRAALGPWDTGSTAPTLVENLDQPQRHLTADQLRAVAELRAVVDPAGLFAGDTAPRQKDTSEDAQQF